MKKGFIPSSPSSVAPHLLLPKPPLVSDFLSPPSATRYGRPYTSKTKANRFRPLTSHDFPSEQVSSPVLISPVTSSPYNFPIPPAVIAAIAPSRFLEPRSNDSMYLGGGSAFSQGECSDLAGSSLPLVGASVGAGLASGIFLDKDENLLTQAGILGSEPELVAPVYAAASSDLAVAGLQALYTSLNNPPQLTGWNFTNGDPCSKNQTWVGITCSGSSVISIYMNGLGLSGMLSPQISNLLSLQELDLSYNNIGGQVSHGLPPNATYINLAMNSFGFSLDHPFPSLKSLNYLNVSHNRLSGFIGDVFTDMQKLDKLDLSFNHLVGDLPRSFASLTNLRTLYLQNNELTGSVGYLTNLPLVVLNIEHNRFSGYLPRGFQHILVLLTDGNNFSPGFDHSNPLVNGSSNGVRV